MGGAPLPPGWTSAIDPSSGQTYYANPHTGASSWEPPPLAVVPPPPPPPPMRHPPVAQHYQHPQQQPQYHHAQQQHTQHYPPQPIHNHTTAASNNTNNHVVHQQLLQSQAQGFTAAQTPTITSSTTPTPTNPLHAELTTLTVGQMADLCALRQEAQAAAQGDDHIIIKEGLEAYTPLNPIAVVPGGTMMGRPMMEAGRLDIRIHSLHDKLTKLKTGATTR